MTDKMLSEKRNNKSDLIRLINEVLKDEGLDLKLTEEKYNLFCKAFELHRSDREVIGEKMEMPEMPKSPTGEIVLYHLVPNSYFHVNAKITTLVAAATALDAWLTAGLANMLLGLSGQTKQALSKLNPEDGQYCNWCIGKKIVDANNNLEPASVVSEIKGAPCWLQDLDCIWMKDENVCTIEDFAVEENFEILREKGALIKQRHEWSIPL